MRKSDAIARKVENAHFFKSNRCKFCTVVSKSLNVEFTACTEIARQAYATVAAAESEGGLEPGPLPVGELHASREPISTAATRMGIALTATERQGREYQAA